MLAEAGMPAARRLTSRCERVTECYRYREDFPLQSLQSRCITKCCHSVYGLARGHLILKTFFEFEFLQKGNSKRILKTSTEITEFTLISL